MATISEVLAFLIPNGGYAAMGEKYEDIKFLECEPITKEQFELGFAQVEEWKKQNELDKETKKIAAQEKLAALGLTTDDLKALGL